MPSAEATIQSLRRDIALQVSRVTLAHGSKLAKEARESLLASERRLTPGERLEAFLEHNQLLGQLHQAARAAEQRRVRGLTGAT